MAFTSNRSRLILVFGRLPHYLSVERGLRNANCMELDLALKLMKTSGAA